MKFCGRLCDVIGGRFVYAVLVVVLSLAPFCMAYAADPLKFSPAHGVSATVDIGDDAIFVGIETKELNIKQVINFDVSSERAVHVAIEDYNFDGVFDFSVWYLDEGMGIYTIHRIFLFSKNENFFVEYLPRCGDAFVNLRVDNAKKRLISTYFENNRARTCISRPW